MNPALLDNITHRHLRIHTERAAQRGDARHFALALPAEFRQLQAHFPIVFQLVDGGAGFQPVALFGLEEGQNVFLTDTGWDAPVVPMALQRDPFLIGRGPDDSLQLHIDLDSPRIVRAHEGEVGTALFMPHGGFSEYLDHVVQLMEHLHAQAQQLPAFIEALTGHQLLEPFAIDIETPDGEQQRLTGLFTIHEERLAALPGFLDANGLGLGARDALVSLWLGNRTRIAAHYDLPDNLAIVAAGRRRFTVFPPEQLPNLYLGPLDPTPAGQPVSLVDFHQPDFERFPRFRDALAAGEAAELAPGDAVYIPSMWFHHVEGLAPVNLLINAWWRQTADHVDSPLSTLRLALMTLRDLPEKEKRIWRHHFQHFVFEANEDTWAHIPPAARGLLGPIDEPLSRQARTQLLNQLKR